MRALPMLALVMFPACALAAECEGNVAAGPSDVAATGLEYALGMPRTVQVEDQGEIKRLSYVRVGPYAVFEGDIILGEASRIEFTAQSGPIRLQYHIDTDPTGMKPFGYAARSVIAGPQKWTDNTVPYVIDPKLPVANLVLAAMQAWSKVTKLKFEERTPSNANRYPNYVFFTVGANPKACLSSGVGMMGGKQNVELVSGCGFGQIVHEIGHVIGLHHEQNRADRDKQVHVQTANILKGYAPQFEQRPTKFADVSSYDFDSIMHYDTRAFSCNGQPTIVPVQALPPGIKLGQRDHISAGDAAVINGIYK